MIFLSDLTLKYPVGKEGRVRTITLGEYTISRQLVLIRLF